MGRPVHADQYCPAGNQAEQRHPVRPGVFVATMEEAWSSSITDPASGATVRMLDIPRNGYPDGVGPDDPLPANVQTYGQYLDGNVHVPIAAAMPPRDCPIRNCASGASIS